MLGVSGSWRHLTPGNRVAGLGSRRAVRAARSALRTSGEEVFGGVEVAALVKKKNGRISGFPPTANMCIFIRSQRARLLEGFGSIFSIVCAGSPEPEVGVAPGQAGLLRCAAARFFSRRTAPLSSRFVGRL